MVGGGRGMASENVGDAGEAWPRPYAVRSTGVARRGEAMPRPPLSSRGYPDPVSYVLNPHTMSLNWPYTYNAHPFPGPLRLVA